ncbi:DUF6221 family protein [Streptomyces sp900116325]|uniref:DUF6221 family protein n=1 Tax=Streptomyces sp. 900116325 TaxID=3154295 RepID=UPI0033E1E625
MTDLTDFLHARYVDARRAAEGRRRFILSGFDGHDVEIRPDEPNHVFVGGQPILAEQYWAAATEADPDPAVIADLDAKEALVADLLADQHHADHEDPWYSCATITDGDAACLDAERAGGPCDCGRDARVERRLRILAQPFAGHPDYVGEVPTDTP